MHITARSEEAISRSLTVLRWQNRIAGVMVGCFIAFFAAMIAGLSPAFLPYAVVLGAAIGLMLAIRHWKRSIGRMGRSFLKLDDEYLEAQGIVNGGLTHCRFRLDDIGTFQLGQDTAVGAALPVVRAFERAALVIRDKAGDGVVLQLAGIVFDADELSRLWQLVALRVQQLKMPNQSSQPTRPAGG